MNTNKLSIIESIKSRRIELKIDQATLARESGLSQSTISQVEKGRKSLSLDALQRVCFFLNLEIKIIEKTDSAS